MKENMVTVTIDDQNIDVPSQTTILQATQLLGIEVPMFCYHPRLSIAGNCRMCLVEVEGSRKPVASCAIPVEDGMIVRTTTPFVKKSREGALEFLLLNHPLDCPICDQGGECDLQDITFAYGQDKTRLNFPKRAIPKKEFGPLIKTEMTRCIHCTRCVRFATEVAGVPELGAINRGGYTEIVSLLDKPFASELSGNIIDLCPVGALTSKPYAFKGRPWEMRKTETIDVMDAVGSHIRVDTRGLEVVRVLPRVFDPINEEWISDKTRFAYDGLSKQRLDRPYIKRAEGKWEESTWEETFTYTASALSALQGEEIAAIIGDMADVESMFALKKLMADLKSPNIDCRQDNAGCFPDVPESYRLNTPIARLEEADFLLLVGCNPRIEAPLINNRLRKAYTRGNLEAAYVGPPTELNYPAIGLGAHLPILEEIASGDHPIAKKLKEAQKPVIMVGQAVLRRPDWERTLHISYKIADNYGAITKEWCGFNVLQLAASRVGGLMLGCVPTGAYKNVNDILKGAHAGKIKAVYLLGADEIDTSSLKDTFVIYQGHHGDRGAEAADVILPGCAYTEKEGMYVNAEGRPQIALRACPAPGEAERDWRILYQLAKKLGKQWKWECITDVRAELFKEHPELSAIGELPSKPFASFIKKFSDTKHFVHEALAPAIQNFYHTDPISRQSKTMALCAKTFLTSNVEAQG